MMKVDQYGNWYEEDVTGPAPIPQPTVFFPPLQDHTHILQAILNTLKEIQEELVYIKNMSRY